MEVHDCPAAGTNWRGSYAQNYQHGEKASCLVPLSRMLTSQILQCSGGDEASASNWEPQAVQIGNSVASMLPLLEDTGALVSNQ